MNSWLSIPPSARNRFATGCHMEPIDEFVIEGILQADQKDGYSLRTLIVEALASEIFRSR